MIGAYMDNREATAAYASAFRRLSRMSGFDHRVVLRAEVGIILKTWAGRTKVSTVQQADRRSKLHAVKSLGYTQGDERGDVTVNAGWRPAPFGRVWIRVRTGAGSHAWILAKGAAFSAPQGSATFSMVGRQLYNPKNRGDSDRSTSFQWMENVNLAVSQVQAKLDSAIEKGRRAVALARQSVVQIADSMGIELDRVQGGGLSSAGLAKARAAMATNGRFWQNGFSSQVGDETSYYVDLINRLPYGTAVGMDSTLTGVVAGRAKFIERSYAKGVFDNQNTILRAFPNLFYRRN